MQLQLVTNPTFQNTKESYNRINMSNSSKIITLKNTAEILTVSFIIHGKYDATRFEQIAECMRANFWPSYGGRWGEVGGVVGDTMGRIVVTYDCKQKDMGDAIGILGMNFKPSFTINVDAG
jgi:hypothetical protein